jgi:Kdo2-lipid IVA lauroyltransferase/acyltransferase
MNKDKTTYFFIRLLTIPFSYLPFKVIHILGYFFGIIAYFCLKNFRKRALSNLALAKDLNLTTSQIKINAIKSFQNLAINILEYPRFHRKKNLDRIINCQNPQIANILYSQKRGIIFFCGHQSNWEALFLDGTKRMKGVAIGKPIKNKKLYKWVTSIREKNGGKMITPKNALKEGFKALKKGVFLGIVGDQGMPDSNYHYPFLGRRAFSTTAPALLSYKTNSPIIVATTKRKFGYYEIYYSDPIWPDLKKPLENEVVNLMNKSFSLLENSIKASPHEWLWQHNRWKQQTPKTLFKEYRHDCIATILPLEEKQFNDSISSLETIKELYNRDFIYIFCPIKFKDKLPNLQFEKIYYYHSYQDLLIKDYKYKLIYNFTPFRSLKSHFLKLGAFDVLSIKDLLKISNSRNYKPSKLSDIIKSAICRNPSNISS